MELLAGACTSGECKQIGQYLLSLLSDPSWVHRRVETVELVSRVAAQRRVSLDVDVGELVRRAEIAGFQEPKRVYFPLTLLRKVLLPDLDVRDDEDRAISVVTSDRDSHAAHAVLLETARRAHYDPDAFCTEIVQTLYEIVRQPPSTDDRTAIERSWYRSADISAWKLRERGLTVSKADEDLWDELFSNEEFVRRAAEFTTKYMPIVAIDTGRPQRIVKFRLVEPLITPYRPVGIREFFSVPQGRFNIDISGIGRARREHLRILAPGGTFITSANVVTPPSPNPPSRTLGPPRGGNTYRRRLTLERALVYSWDTPPGSYQVHFGLRPSLRGFQVPALTALVLSFLILALGAAGEALGDVLTDIAENRTEPAVALLLVVPTLAVAYIAREGEHEVRAHLLKYVRYTVGAAGGFTLVAAVALILQLKGWQLATVWAIGGAYCLLALAAVINTCRVIAEKRKKVYLASYEQQDRSILRYV